MATTRKRRYKAYRDDPDEQISERTARRWRRQFEGHSLTHEVNFTSSAGSKETELCDSPNAQLEDDLIGPDENATLQASVNPGALPDEAWSVSPEEGMESEQSVLEDTQDDQVQTGVISIEDQHAEDYRPEMEFLTSEGELYPGSPISAGVSHLMIMAFAIKHKLTATALDDLVKLIEAHCPSKNKCAESAYVLRKQFSSKLYRDPPPKVYFCCSCCQTPLTSAKDKCAFEECVQEKAKAMKFYHMDVEGQLQRFYKDSTFRKNLTTGQMSEDDTIRDVYDGLKYRSLKKEGGFLDGTGNLTFTFNSDGVKIYASSRTSQLWPAFLAINELSPILRFSKRYLLLAGFWCAPGKPTMTTFLVPLMTTLNKIHEEGVIVRDQVNSVRTVKGLLLLCSVDLQAKAILSNTKQYNGAHGCSNCEDEGKSLKGGHRIWPYAGPTTLRTHAKYLQYVDIVEASATGNREPVPHKGIKGASVFLLHEPFDMGQGFAIDWMHCVLMGVVKTLMGLWFGSPKEDFYIGREMPLLDERLLGLKIPNCISHAPRTLADRQHWKASELRAWLLHYSLPVLRDVLSKEYYAHYALLVAAISTLVSDAITQEQLQNAEAQLDVFCKTLKNKYGEAAQTMNFHLLRHLAYHVKLYGPLFSFSCFGFETMNGHVKRMIHGTRFVVDQITFTAAMSDNLQRLVKAMDPKRDSEKAVDVAKKLAGNEKRNNMTELTPGVSSVGKRTIIDLATVDQDIVSAVERRVGTHAVPQSHVFHRVCLDRMYGQIVYSKKYGRERARNNRTVEYKEHGRIQYGEVVLFCHVHDEVLAVLKVLEQIDVPIINVDDVSDPNVKQALGLDMENFVVEVVETNTYSAIPVTDLYRKCVFMEIDHGDNRSTYIGRFPNVCEHD